MERGRLRQMKGIRADWQRFVVTTSLMRVADQWRLAGSTIVAAVLVTVAVLRPGSIAHDVSASRANIASEQEATMPWYIVYAPPVKIETIIHSVKSESPRSVLVLRGSNAAYTVGHGPYSTQQEAEYYNHEHPPVDGMVGKIVQSSSPFEAMMAIVREDAAVRRALLQKR